jgi:hypothetical protein
MATFPFLPKDQAAGSPATKITVARQPKTLTMDDIADRIAPRFPDHSPQEVRDIVRAISKKIIEILLSGRDFEFPDGTIWSLDVDGRTIIIYPPNNKL